MLVNGNLVPIIFIKSLFTSLILQAYHRLQALNFF